MAPAPMTAIFIESSVTLRPLEQLTAAEARIRSNFTAAAHPHAAILELGTCRTDRAPDWSACSPPLRSSRMDNEPFGVRSSTAFHSAIRLVDGDTAQPASRSA